MKIPIKTFRGLTFVPVLLILVSCQPQSSGPAKETEPGSGLAATAAGSDESAAAEAGAEVLPRAETSILRVNVTSQAHNFIQPWEKLSPRTRRALGAVISENRVLVTAELVANATFIELEEPATGKRVAAKVEAVDYEVDLAVLNPVEDGPNLLEGKTPLSLDHDATIGDEVEVWQIEGNGTPVITRGEIINVDVGTYFIAGMHFLVYEVNTTLRFHEGSFNLPVARDGNLVGLLISYDSQQQVADLIPAPMIRSFLERVAEEGYSGFPSLGIAFSRTVDDQLRSYLKLDEDNGGIYVSRIDSDGPASKAGVQPGDVVLKINGREIDSRGNYEDEKYGKINLSHLVKGNVRVGDKIALTLVRDGKQAEVDVIAEQKKAGDYIIDPYMIGRGPRFLVLGGIVFQELTRDYLKSWGAKWQSRAPFRLVFSHLYPEKLKEEGLKKVVFLSRVLPTPSTMGYENLAQQRVTKVNGKKITCLADMAEALKSPEGEFHRIDFEEFPRTIYLHVRQVEVVNERLKALYGLSKLRNLD